MKSYCAKNSLRRLTRNTTGLRWWLEIKIPTYIFFGYQEFKRFISLFLFRFISKQYKLIYSLLMHPFISAHPQIMRFGALLAVHLILIIMSKRWCCFIRYPLVTDRPLCFLSGIHALSERRLIWTCWMVYPALQVYQWIMINEINNEPQENVFCFVIVF